MIAGFPNSTVARREPRDPDQPHAVQEISWIEPSVGISGAQELFERCLQFYDKDKCLILCKETKKILLPTLDLHSKLIFILDIITICDVRTPHREGSSRSELA